MKLNYLCQITAASPESLTRGLPPPDSRSLCPLSSTEFVEPPRTKFIGTLLKTNTERVGVTTVSAEKE